MNKIVKRYLTCCICGQSFIHRNQRKYCSLTCYSNRAAALPVKLCGTCGQPFGAKAYRGRGSQKYCSRPCADIGRARPHPTHTCKRCGKVFSFYPSRMNHNPPVYCSKECAYTARKHYDIEYRRLHTRDWRDLRDSILDRDKHRCTRCGISEKLERLDIHHVIPWRISRDDGLKNLITLCLPCHRTVEAAPRYQLPMPL